ncbi:cytochrome P450 [Sphingomonas montanisoli]|nr:cytochrome P450 [Sphingomonas montanisoli]
MIDVEEEERLYRELFDVSNEAKEIGNEIHVDIVPAMNALRDAAPVMPGSLQQLLELDGHTINNWDVERDSYTLLSFAACDRALRENLTFSSAGYLETPGVRSMGPVILAMTGDEHRRTRAVAQSMFLKPRAVNWWGPNWIDEIVEQLMQRLDGRDTAELNIELCARLPVNVVTRGIGMEGRMALVFRDHLLKATGVRKVTREEQHASHIEVGRMLGDLIQLRRAEPGDDVITGLIHNDFKLADGGTRKLSDEEIIGFCRLVILAGGGTTWRQLGITIYALLSNYHFWEACRDDRSLIEAAIEESARWMPTDPVFPRLMTEDAVVDGVPVPAGVRIDMCLGSANRDPSRWENPDVYDLFREKKYHLGFGLGPHQCLGMNVAKQEMIVALNALMDRFPNMRLDPAAPPPRIVGGLEQRGMSAIPVLLH